MREGVEGEEYQGAVRSIMGKEAMQALRRKGRWRMAWMATLELLASENICPNFGNIAPNFDTSAPSGKEGHDGRWGTNDSHQHFHHE